MKSPKHVLLFAIILSLAIIVAACGSSTASGTYSTSGSTSAATTSPGSSSSNVVIQTAMATVKGKSTTILTNAQGMTLYYLVADTATQSMCSGSCSQTW